MDVNACRLHKMILQTSNKNFLPKLLRCRDAIKMYGNKVGMEETQEYNYPTSIALHNTN